MCLTEYNEERVLQSIREEEFEFGLKQGIEQGIEQLIMNSYRKGKTPEAIAEFMDMPLEKVKKIIADYQKAE